MGVLLYSVGRRQNDVPPHAAGSKRMQRCNDATRVLNKQPNLPRRFPGRRAKREPLLWGLVER